MKSIVPDLSEKIMACMLNTELEINFLPKDWFSDWSKLKALADDTINVIEKLKFILVRVENNVGKENAGYQLFLLFPQCFQKFFYTGSLKNWILW